MSRRRKLDYLYVFQAIFSLIQRQYNRKPDVKYIYIDFEGALWTSLREFIRDSSLDITLKGCYFHFTQAVFRHDISYKLRPKYNCAGFVMNVIRKLMTLPLLV